MWFSFWKPRDRFSLDELRYLTDQLMKIQVINKVNKDFVIEALRSIAELITYGDQHDSSFFEFFMEKQVMEEFVRVLRLSRTVIISLQLLQTVSIMIQNLKSEHSIYYMFSNEYINYLITYKFDFRSEELVSYYISFLRAISGKLNKNTISLLIKIQNDEVVAFPLYEEAIRFAFHEESMVCTAVRALTLNVYHVGDEFVNKYVSSKPRADYFLNLVGFFRDQCISLNKLVANATNNKSSETTSKILSAVDDIEDNLYYFSDVISAGIPDVGRLITDNLLKLLIFPYLLPSLRRELVHGTMFDAVASVYVLCCILRIVKMKDLANTVAAALFCHMKAFTPSSEARPNGYTCFVCFSHESQVASSGVNDLELDFGSLRLTQNSTVCLRKSIRDVSLHDNTESHLALRDALLSYITNGDDVQVMGSINIMATLLQTKDALGILPERKKQKKLLLQALVGEGSGEEQLFSAEGLTKEGCGDELTSYIDRLKNQYGVSCSCPEVRESPRVHNFQVFDALVSLFCRSDISAETLWDGGWLLRQLLPYRETEFTNDHLNILKDSYMKCSNRLIKECRGSWPDLLIAVFCDEWRKCKRAIEASSPRKELKCILLPQHKLSAEDQSDSSLASGERMCELVKVFVLFHQLCIFSVGRPLPDQPPMNPPIDFPEKCRAKTAGVDKIGPKPSAELSLVDAVPCKIAFERGKERHFSFLAISLGSSGWVVLAEELTSKVHRGVVRIAAPLAGCNPKVDDKHSRWLHLRIRPTNFPYRDAVNFTCQGKTKSRALVDGRWTLAFPDESSCKSALSMIVEELNLQSSEVERMLRPLLDFESELERSVSYLNSSDLEPPSPRIPVNSL
ncbi:protein TRANSPARENT TESTA 9-like isoform X2 [Apium graveolens]|uniref:protein TRANSPARENT TESTA 9-like isoform X2 n=1 Tax=Apium graveolens TaxID=4045 RepID=UPI003D78CCD9